MPAQGTIPTRLPRSGSVSNSVGLSPAPHETSALRSKAIRPGFNRQHDAITFHSQKLYALHLGKRFTAFSDILSRGCGHIHRPRRIRRDCRFQLEAVRRTSPVAHNTALDGIVMRLYPIDRRVIGIAAGRRQQWMDNDALVARAAGLDARQFAQHPFADRTEGIVREGIHGGVLLAVHAAETMGLGIAVPMFPDRRRALVHFVTPRRKFPALKMFHRQIVLTGTAQHWQQRARTEETGGHAGIVGGLTGA